MSCKILGEAIKVEPARAERARKDRSAIRTRPHTTWSKLATPRHVRLNRCPQAGRVERRWSIISCR